MIKLYSWPTPNGHKIHIALEELELPYEVIAVDIGKGEQLKPDFLAINPNNRIPAIVDEEGPSGPLTLFESGAILVYLAEKTGKLLPKDPVARYVALQWLMFQMGGVGPMFGQQGHFSVYAPEKIPYAIQRYESEVKRLHRVLEKRLATSEYLGGPEYSIADIATYPWVRPLAWRNIDFSELPSVSRWLAAISARPAVQRGLAVLKDHQSSAGPIDEKQREILFGTKQFEQR